MTTDFDRYQSERPRRIRSVSERVPETKPSIVDQIKALPRVGWTAVGKWDHCDDGPCLEYDAVMAILEAE